MRLDAKKEKSFYSGRSVEEKSSQTKQQQLWKLVLHIHRGGIQQSRNTLSIARILSSSLLYCVLLVYLYSDNNLEYCTFF